ncbi:RagB/SusD family nutrient uptake outer membrane protein [Polaribacter tangerinus]|uniref:RagB/SusD family nutrient uptake outer membrane protein n=1 Tax=Polaribacter tangerinus TaxID=1920034 RepID=UPI000B4B02BB|nr:RagB/SusD family nutrient uptake outer membrane protein [Polaribacter tangerinus]
MLKKISVLLLMVLSVAITSCSEDYLETKPTDAISAGDALSTPENMALVLNGLHRLMYAQQGIIPGGSNSRAGMQYWVPMFDVMCGDLIHTARSNGWMRSELQWNTHTLETTSTVEQLWYQRYHFIASTNAIINKVKDDGLTIDANMNNILGQAYAYRAWAYHSLVTTYAKGYLIGNPSTDPGVPLLFKTEAPYTSEPRSTVQVIYDQINEDIATSIEFFKKASARVDKSQLDLNTAYGIKARIALSEGNWLAAADAASKARQGYPLLDEAGWKSGFNTTDLSEVIWGGRVIQTETTFFRSYFYYISPTFQGSQNRGNPKIINKEVYHMIPESDYRADLFLEKAPNTNGAAANGEGGSYQTDPNYNDKASFDQARRDNEAAWGITSRHNQHPYMHVKFRQKNPGTIDPDDVIYMRSSEMYLIEAEARAMLEDVQGAQAALKPLGEARDTAYDVTDFDTKEKLMEHIKFQRRVELYGEGFSWLDHIRWDEGIDLTNSGASEVLYQDGFKQDKPSVNNAWIWKIPQAEINANPNLTEADQN